jgi:hypothetical protein
MSKVKILAGDLAAGTYGFSTGLIGKQAFLRKELSVDMIPLHNQLERVEIQTEESVKKLGGTAGWGITGAVLLGPLGAIGGMLIGGRAKEVCFAAYLKDGRKFLATTDGKTYQKIAAAAF